MKEDLIEIESDEPTEVKSSLDDLKVYFGFQIKIMGVKFKVSVSKYN